MLKKDKCTLATCPECERVNQNKGAEEYPWIKNRMIRKFMARLSGSGPALAPAGTLASTFRYPFLLTPGTLPADLSDTFIVNTVDSGMKTFLSNCEAATAATGSLMINAFMQSMLKPCVSTTSINGFLNRGLMYIMSTEQFREHLLKGRDESGMGPMETLLDIGAGDGNVTAQLGKLVSGQIYATEASPVMQWRLRRRGYQCLGITEWVKPTFYDVISCLNVLDRCDRPEDLIKDLRDSVVPGTGRIVIAVVLPFRPSVEVGSKWVAPSQRLPVTGSTAHQHAKSFAKDVFEPLGMKVEAISRAPYLCEGDITQPYYLLHDYIYVLSVPQEP